MRINHNLMAINAHRQMGITSGYQSKAMEKLSSGLRINRAGDDAAGLAISEKMRGQIRGLNQASRNAQDGISLIQTAEGAMNEVHSILQRMRELAVQAANDTYTDTDRSNLQREVQQLKSEVDRISSDTEFNAKKLLDGSNGQNIAITTNTAEIIDARAVDTEAEGTFTLTFNGVTTGTSKFISSGGIQETDVIVANTAGITGIESGSYSIKLACSAGDGTATTAVMYDANGNEVGRTAGVIDNSANDIEIQNAGGDVLLTIATGAYNGQAANLKFDVTISADIDVLHPDGSNTSYTGLNANSNSIITVAGLELDVATNLQGGGGEQAVIDVANNGVYFHIGANENQTTRMAIGKIDAATLQVDDLDITIQTGAEAAITAANSALDKVSFERSKLGAVQNRLEHTIKNLDTAGENLQAAESRIRDVDMAKEMMNFTKQNILQQAANAMLAQANQAPQAVLQLLR